MKVLLVRPFNKFCYSITPPLGLGYLASALKSKGKHEVFLYDANRDALPKISSFYDCITRIKPDIIGIQVYSVDLPVVKEYLGCIKKYSSRIITVLGGPHPSSLPDETMSRFGHDLDFAIMGEGERAFLSLVNTTAEGRNSWDSIAGLVWRNQSGGVAKNAREEIGDIDDLPWPEWELLNPATYPHAPLGAFVKRFPVAPIIISRGCSMKCNFCAASAIYGDSVRYRDIDNVIAEIKHLISRFNIKEITIQDDNFTFKKSAVMEFCDKVRGLRIDWNCLNGIRLNFIDDEMAKAMKDSGCYAVAAGIESGSQKILDDMNKKLKIEQTREKIAILAKYKIKITGQFIIGYPTETREDILRTIKFAKELPIERAAFASFMPLPGSKVYFDLEQRGVLKDVAFGEMSYYSVLESFTPHVSRTELERLLKRAIRSFHLRPIITWKALFSIKSFLNFWNLLKRFVKNYI